MKLKKDRAYSLIEVILIVMMLGIFAAIAVPRLNFAVVSKYKAKTVARKIAADFRLARRLAISDAANNTFGYELVLTGAIPYDTYNIRNLKGLVVVSSHTIDSDVTVDSPTGIRFMFGPLGNAKIGSAHRLIVSGGGKSFTIDIHLATGAVECAEN